MGKVMAVALALTVGPVGISLLAVRLFKFLFFTIGLSFVEANAVNIMFIAFPFFLGATWVFFNADKWAAFILKRIGS